MDQPCWGGNGCNGTAWCQEVRPHERSLKPEPSSQLARRTRDFQAQQRTTTASNPRRIDRTARYDRVSAIFASSVLTRSRLPDARLGQIGRAVNYNRP